MDDVLNSESWRNLETLLSKAGMFTQFLTEQLSKFDENLAGSAEQVKIGSGQRRQICFADVCALTIAVHDLSAVQVRLPALAPCLWPGTALLVCR